MNASFFESLESRRMMSASTGAQDMALGNDAAISESHQVIKATAKADEIDNEAPPET